MRKIIVVTYMTMDGVLQAPGGPEEDRTNGFQYGGWMFPYVDEQMGNILNKIMASPFDLLLGRRTYEIFSAYWPYKNDKVGETFTRVNKYVVATTPLDLSWQNSILINTDVVNALKKLKEQDGPDLLIWGSSRLLQTLFSNRLVDELHTWTFPIILGNGKRLFEEGIAAQEWKLTDSIVSTTGVVIATYVPNGQVKLGSFVEEEASKAELARREKWNQE